MRDATNLFMWRREINAQRVWGAFKMHWVAMSARNDSICLECLPCRAKCMRGVPWQREQPENCRRLIAAGAAPPSQIQCTAVGIKMQNCILLLCCRTRDCAAKKGSEGRAFFFLFSQAFFRCSLCVFFWSNVKCDARGSSQIWSFIN